MGSGNVALEQDAMRFEPSRLAEIDAWRIDANGVDVAFAEKPAGGIWMQPWET